MKQPILEIEDVWEEVLQQAQHLHGRKVRLPVYSCEDSEAEKPLHPMLQPLPELASTLSSSLILGSHLGGG